MSKVKKILALSIAAVTAMGMSVTTYALPESTSATITINNAGPNAKFNYVQIVEANPTTETGWDIKDDYLDEFQDTDAFGEIDEQTILNGMIYKATSGANGVEISGFDTKYAAALDAVWEEITAPTAQSGSASPITVQAAGVYVIRGYEADYTYGTMAGYVAFEPYDTTTGLPTDLKDTSVEAKRVPNKTTKTAEDEDKVVGIGRIVSYTVTSTVPYFAPTDLNTAEYWFGDTISGAEYVLNDDEKVEVSVETSSGFKKTYPVDPDTTTNAPKQSISVNLSEILEDNKYANDTITITYEAKVTDVYVGNDAFTGKGENDPSFGKDKEELFTGDVTMTKYNEDGTVQLEGAGFQVKKVGDDQTVLKFTKVGDGVYKYDQESGEEEVFTGKNGTVTLQGLDLGGYEFKETTAPEGYTINAETRVAVVELVEGKETAETEEDVKDGSTSLNDTKLSSLPSTGGIGTTIFTIGGCAIMIVAAGLYFATRKKTEK